MTTKEECKSIGYIWVESYRKNNGEFVRGYCKNPSNKEEEYRYIRGEYKDTPEEAYDSLREEMRKEYRVNRKLPPPDQDLFYPSDFHFDWEKTGKAPEYHYKEGMMKAKEGKNPGFGTGVSEGDKVYYMEGHIKKEGKKYIASGEAVGW